MAKTPAPRGFTLADQDALKFEKHTLRGVQAVTAMAFAISFVALAWTARDLGIPWGVNLLLPGAIDGFAIVCTIGIARAAMTGQRAGWEWIGLCAALGMSVAGNVYHAVEVGDPGMPLALKVAFGTAIPLFVALGIHVYVRAINTGLRANIMADDPEQVRFDITQLPTTGAAPARTAPAARAPQPTAQRAPRAEPARADSAHDARVTALPARTDDARATRTDARAWRSVVADRTRTYADATGKKIDAAALHRELGLPHTEPTTRKRVADVYTEWHIDKYGVPPGDSNQAPDRATA